MGAFYSWTWGDVHLVSLNSYPSYEWDPACEWCHYFTRSFREPEESLQFLEEDLRQVIRDYDVLAIFHGHSHNIQFSGWSSPTFRGGEGGQPDLETP